MRYSWTLVVVALVAQSISALPLGRQGFIVADIISSRVDDLVKRNYALPIPNSKYVKRVADDELVDDAGIELNPLISFYPVEIPTEQLPPAI